MQKLDVGPTPDYEEIRERFGNKVPAKELLDETNTLQSRYSDLYGIGSILASEEVYGYKDLRQTSCGGDFVGSRNTISQLTAENDEDWTYEGSYIFPDLKEGEEWLIAVIPFEQDIFYDEDIGGYSIGHEEKNHARTVDTSEGKVDVVSPETGIDSKLRRYIMQRKNRSSFKEGDLLDVANILLAKSEGSTDYSVDRLCENIYETSGKHLLQADWKKDTLTSIQDSGANIDPYEWAKIQTEMNEIEELLSRK